MQACGKTSIACEYKQKCTVVEFEVASKTRRPKCPRIENMQGDETSTKDQRHQCKARQSTRRIQGCF